MLPSVDPESERRTHRDVPGLDNPPEEWAGLGERGEAARLMYERGLLAKARRFADCGRTGMAMDCSVNRAHGTYRLFRCGARFCRDCAAQNIAAVINKHVPRIMGFVGRQPARQGWTLAMLTLTVPADGSEIVPQQVRTFNRHVRRFLRLAPRRGVFQAGCKLGPGEKPGLLWIDEVGAERQGHTPNRVAGGRNLHCHAVYYGPFLDYERARDLWREITGGATGFYVKEIKGWKKRAANGSGWRVQLHKALYYALKYTGKAPAESAARVAELERAFHRVRRVHTAGAFYNLPEPEPESETASRHAARPAGPQCPYCGAAAVVSRHRQPIAMLLDQGRHDAGEIERAAAQARALGGGCGP